MRYEHVDDVSLHTYIDTYIHRYSEFAICYSCIRGSLRLAPNYLSLLFFKETDRILSGKKCVHLARKHLHLEEQTEFNKFRCYLEHEAANDNLYLSLLHSKSI